MGKKKTITEHCTVEIWLKKPIHHTHMRTKSFDTADEAERVARRIKRNNGDLPQVLADMFEIPTDALLNGIRITTVKTIEKWVLEQ